MSDDRRDFIAIPTCERPRELIACLTCLREAMGLERFRIVVRDDASTEFDIGLIRHLLPQAERIERSETRLGAGTSHFKLFDDCLAAGAQRILVLDSDLIISPVGLEFALRALPRTDGVLSLYNSILHEPSGALDDELLIKPSVGGAGTFWDASVLAHVVNTYRRDEGDGWDWHATHLLAREGRRIMVSRRSYVQHLGLSGLNNGNFGHIEYGLGFVVETETQARFMAAALETLMTRQEAYLAPKPRDRRWHRRVLDALRPGGRDD